MGKTSKDVILIILAFFAIYVIWGSTYLLNKIAVNELEPFMLAVFRFAVAGILIFVICSVLGYSIRLSVRQIMMSRSIICTVPDARKAEAVRNAVEGEVTPQVPSSILQQHPDCVMVLDPPAAGLLQSPS